MAQDEYENKNAGELRDILKSITGELSRQRTIQAESAAEYRKMDSIARNLQDTTMGISNLSSDELAKLRQKNESHIKELQYQAERLSRQKIGAKFDGQINTNLIDRLKFLGKLSTQEEAILRAAADKYKIEKELTDEVTEQYTKRLAFEQQVNRSLGVGGALVGGIDALMSKLGMNSGIFKQSVDQANKAMKEAAEEAARTGTHISRISVMMKGLGPLSKGFSAALTDPLTIITKILDTYFKINKASVDVQHLTGQNAVAAAAWGANYASAVDYLETISALTKQTGMNAQNIFSSQVVGQAAALKTTMGLTADEAGGLATISQTTGKEVNGIVDSVVATTSAFNGANRAAVSQGAVLREVANTSDSIKLSLGNNPEALAKAAAAATRLGLSLKDVDNISASLTDFQSSISNELEAELLTGKDLNLEKARELALNNDLEGVSKELFKNSSDIAEFGKMNRIQQESYAKALGMTKDQLAKMAYNKALEAGMTEDQAAAAANVNAEDMKRVAAQENFAKALEKIAGAVAPILDVVGNILSMPLVPYLLLGALAVGKMGAGLTGMLGSIKGVATGAKDIVSNLSKGGVKGALGGVKSMLGSKVDAVAEQEAAAGGKVSDIADKTKNVKAGTGVKDFLTNLGEGLAALGKSLANGQVILGLVVLTGALIGIGYALKLAAPGIEAFGKVVSAIFTGLAEIITAVAAGFVTLMGAVTMENVGPMLLLGPALFGIAAGLAAIAVAGVLAIPALIAMKGLATVTGGAATIFGAGETSSAGEAKSKSDEGSLAAVEAKLDALVAAVKAGGNVYLDSNKVGRAQVLGSYKSS